jgi:ABC-type iron transport system FetAB permease component
MSEIYVALLIWFPLGTIIPLVIARATGADWRGAFVEASLFATMGLVVFPFLLALIFAIWTTSPNVNVVFAISIVLAIVTGLIFRKRANERMYHGRYRGRR